ncbi:fructokinase [Virgibacillus pantothenticus]|uniref:fructokinase n=1 Tax=Virgibacillus pantothenticus TaxID=1473 RepID=A0A0L0QMQ5_VIRPA|nr:ROK family protein [Virgibacillus pantothenticus]KNE19508.1 fructokinase [Virgibacillus pantothenticus]MBU8565742.1 ROK family protein [Virgibacillus pantothenticus]MBU8599671.1 ROK family protein [Virgibacillus pantothenticus]MBU8634118.1 ROK family protein [Virgibacillus pantothenticus]MBU8642159.1 ROK family protein [Virgibacillus pantothenticus]
MLIGAIEAGGTKFVCAVGDENGRIIEKTSFPTTSPEDTLVMAKKFFSSFKIEALGVGTFGPVNLDRKSTTYGTILNTPKIKWRYYPLLERLKTDYEIPVYLGTDVNAACLGEYHFGAGEQVDSCLYMTVGTGIGAGFVIDGEVFQGKNHPEMGHILIKPHPNDSFIGSCPSHGSCLEGLASGTAMEKRYGVKAHLLENIDHVWEIEAYYLAQALMNYYVILSPEKMIVGGGVMKQAKLYTMVQKQFMELLNGYLEVEHVDELIVAPKLEDEQGVKGAIALAIKDLV